MSGASDPGGAATRPDPTALLRPPLSPPRRTAARTAVLPTDAHFQLRRAPPGMRENPAAPRSDRAPGQSAGRGREATPLRPWGWFPPGAGRGGARRGEQGRTEGRRHLGGGDVNPALCSVPGSCRRLGRGATAAGAAIWQPGRRREAGLQLVELGGPQPQVSQRAVPLATRGSPLRGVGGSLGVTGRDSSGASGPPASPLHRTPVWAVCSKLTLRDSPPQTPVGKMCSHPGSPCTPQSPVRAVCSKLTPRL